jgi:ribonucleoside-diphosphate reductase alpha chain
MTARERLENRRASLSFSFECNGLHYTATISRYADGRLAEIFISNAKAGSHSDAAAKDSAVVASIALPRGVAASPLGVALDLLAEQRS